MWVNGLTNFIIIYFFTFIKLVVKSKIKVLKFKHAC